MGQYLQFRLAWWPTVNGNFGRSVFPHKYMPYTQQAFYTLPPSHKHIYQTENTWPSEKGPASNLYNNISYV